MPRCAVLRWRWCRSAFQPLGGVAVPATAWRWCRWVVQTWWKWWWTMQEMLESAILSWELVLILWIYIYTYFDRNAGHAIYGNGTIVNVKLMIHDEVWWYPIEEKRYRIVSSRTYLLGHPSNLHPGVSLPFHQHPAIIMNMDEYGVNNYLVFFW